MDTVILPNTWRKISVIDLGHNSLKMVSYEVRYDGTYRAYNQISKITRIGEGLSKNGFLDQSRMDETINELKVFSEVNRMEKVHNVLAVATAAVRDATNRDEFLEKSRSNTGVDFRVLTQDEEALFSYVGGARGTSHPDMVFFDLGGGSLEIVYSEGHKIRKVLSLPLGALKMSDQYRIKGRDTSPKDYQKMVGKLSSLLPDRKGLGINGNPILLGVGGTLRALARFDQWNRNYPLYKMHNYEMSRKSLDEIHRLLLDTKVERIAKMNAFGKGRAQSVTAGSIVISMLMQKLGFENIVVSSHGLRDGILTEYLRDPRTFTAGEYQIKDAEAALGMVDMTGPGDEVVASMEAAGFITPWEKDILDEAIGNYMNLYLATRPETLFYSVISQDSKLSHTDQIVEGIAMVRAKAPRMSKWLQERYSMLIEEVDRKSINKMGYIIRLAEILRTSGSKARIVKTDGALRVAVKAGARKSFPELMFKRILGELENSSGMKVEAEFS